MKTSIHFAERVKSGVLLPLGTRVVRGQDWKWGNQDKDQPGTVIQHRQKDSKILSCLSL